jgi:Holliday junction resolvase-like predicted endonuclease
LSIEQKLLISTLKLTPKGSTKQECVYTDAHVPSSYGQNLLQKLQKQKLINLVNGVIRVDTQSRLAIAIQATQLGAPIEQISSYLDWKEFESMAALALELNGYTTQENVHFTNNKKRWEIDVVGARKPLVICIDCKHWHHGMHPAALRKVAETQMQRTKAFVDCLPNGKVEASFLQWTSAVFVPVILSLIPFSQKYCNRVPIVPVLQVQDFIGQLALNLDVVQTFAKKFSHL